MGMRRGDEILEVSISHFFMLFFSISIDKNVIFHMAN